MKRLSDYTGPEAIDLWADIFEPVSTIVNDDDIREYTTGKGLNIQKAVSIILKKYREEAFEILQRIDDGDINGANVFPKLIVFVTELTMGDSAQTFFKSAEPEKPEKKSSGSATANTEDGAK